MGILSIICLFFYLGRSWAQEQTYVVFAPKLFCVGASENVVIQVHGYTEPFVVSIAIKSYPDKHFTYSLGEVSLSPENKFQGSASLIVESQNLPGGATAVSHVYLEVICAHFSKTTKIPLHYDNGYIFIETDKSSYSQYDSVKVRAYTLDEDLKPSAREVILTFIDPEGKETAIVGNNSNPGIVTFPDFNIPSYPKYGLWTIKAKLRENFTTTGTTQFEIKQYESVNLISIEPESNVITYENLEDFKINIKSWYPGEVDIFFFFAIREDLNDNKKEMLLAGVEKTKLIDGAAQISFNTTKEITKMNKSLEDLNNKYLDISVEMLRDFINPGSSISGIKYHIPPYTLALVTTPLFLKPGIPFSIKVQVKNTVGHLAGGVAVILEAKTFAKTLNINQDIMQSTTNSDGVASFVIDIPSNATTLDFHVRTADPDHPAEYQASNDYQAVAYSSHSQSFLSLSWPDSYKTLLVGKTLSITVTSASPYDDQITHYNYLVSSKGKIVHFGTEKKLPGSSSQLLNLALTQHMAPTACLLVYYFVTGDQVTELVSDSVCLKIEEKCDNQLQIHLSQKKAARSRLIDVSLVLETQSESWVALSLVNVDSDRSKSLMERIIQSSYKYSQDCGAGGGRNNAEVLSSAGLTVLTNTYTDHAQQDGGSFKKILRSKRDLKETIDKIASSYKNLNVRSCCYDGAYKSEESCQERVARVTERGAVIPQCVKAFSLCCNEANRLRSKITHYDRNIAHHPPRPRFPPYLIQEDLWNVYHVPKWHRLPLRSPENPTLWEIQGVGVSNNAVPSDRVADMPVTILTIT